MINQPEVKREDEGIHNDKNIWEVNPELDPQKSVAENEIIKSRYGKSQYSCGQCGNDFISRSALKRHQRSHTGEKPFKCDICDKSFTHSCKLKTHKLVHSGKHPFKCSFCVKKYRSS